MCGTIIRMIRAFTKSPYRMMLIVFLLALLVAIVYFNSLGNSFVSDDIPGIVNNLDILTLAGVFKNPIFFLRPLLYFLIYKTVGFDATIFRLVNIVTHFFVVLLAYAVIKQISKKDIVAFISSALFAVHPLAVESVTWISGGSYPQYSLFALASIYFYLKKRHIFSFFFVVIALLLSEKAIVIPLILLLYDVTYSKKIYIKQIWLHVIACMLFGVVYVLHIAPRLAVFSAYTSTKKEMINPFIQIPFALTRYVELFLFPLTLSLYNDKPLITPLEFILRFIFFCTLILGCVFAYKKNRDVFFWMMFFVISLLPTLTPIGINWIVAERYVYLGLVALCTLFALVLEKLLANFRLKIIAIILFIVILSLFAVRTIIRNRDWKNQDSLFLSLKKTAPLNPQTHNNLGDLYSRRGDNQHAVIEFRKAIELNPTYADAYHNLGLTYIELKDYKSAMISFIKAIKYNPYIWQSHQQLARLYFAQKDYISAQKHIQIAIKIDPNNQNLQINLQQIQNIQKK